MEATKKELPELIKTQSTYKLIVPENVELKIRYLLRKFPTTEWSGVLFYKHTGSFENDDLTIICEDIYPMDLGDATFTSYSVNEDVASYVAENIDLIDCETGIIHSHHTMSTFFSGTDTNTLREEGAEQNCVVSLIVNNAGVYNAAITRRIKVHYKINVEKTESSYEFFGDGRINQEGLPTVSNKEIDKEIVEYFMLDVEREETVNPYDYLDARFEEIKENKKKETNDKINRDITYWHNGVPYSDDFSKRHKETKEPRQLTLWETNEMDTDDRNLVNRIVNVLITCNLNFLSEKMPATVNLYNINHMEEVHRELFDGRNGSAFDEWCEFVVSHIIESYTMTDEGSIDLARNVRDTLKGFYKDNSNVYVDGYCDAINQYYIDVF